MCVRDVFLTLCAGGAACDLIPDDELLKPLTNITVVVFLVHGILHVNACQLHSRALCCRCVIWQVYIMGNSVMRDTMFTLRALATGEPVCCHLMAAGHP